MSTSANDETNQGEATRDINQSEAGDQNITQSEPSEIHDSASPRAENYSSCTLPQLPHKELNGVDQSEAEMTEGASNKRSGNLEDSSENGKTDSGARDNAEEEKLSEYEMKSENDVEEKFDEEEKNVCSDSGRSLDGDNDEKNDPEERNGLTEGVESENNIEEKLLGEHSNLAESIPQGSCDENSP